jgi:hypothetical protein
MLVLVHGREAREKAGGPEERKRRRGERGERREGQSYPSAS